ncbi:MAG: hypothetical protein HY209_00360 [Candidatus Omnitrophica bacterium]|nr:hypothetical protein [Candidatus Omnitrophota bacterium]
MNIKTKLLLTTFAAAVALVFTPYAVKAQGANPGVTDKGQESVSVAIDGFCPVCVLSGKKNKGNDHFVTEYNGKIYKFAGMKQQKEFLEDPEKYVADLDAKYKALK